MKPHWKGVGQSTFEDLLDRDLGPSDPSVLETLPAFKGFGAFHRTLTDSTLHKQAEAPVTQSYRQITQALTQRLEISVASSKPTGCRFRDSLSHLIDPVGRASIAQTTEAGAFSGEVAEPEQRLAALEPRNAAEKAAQRLTELERSTTALRCDLNAAMVPEPPRSMRKRISINGIRRVLGL